MLVSALVLALAGSSYSFSSHRHTRVITHHAIPSATSPRSPFNIKNRDTVRSDTSMSMMPPAPTVKVATSLHANNNFIISILSVLAACGIAMEKNTTVGKALSANLVTMLLALFLANIGVIPFSSPVCKCNLVFPTSFDISRSNTLYYLFLTFKMVL